VPNSALLLEDGSYAPAHMLPDARLERAGRQSKVARQVGCVSPLAQLALQSDAVPFVTCGVCLLCRLLHHSAGDMACLAIHQHAAGSSRTTSTGVVDQLPVPLHCTNSGCLLRFSVCRRVQQEACIGQQRCSSSVTKSCLQKSRMQTHRSCAAS
jgi:hypothetical protein